MANVLLQKNSVAGAIQLLRDFIIDNPEDTLALNCSVTIKNPIKKWT